MSRRVRSKTKWFLVVTMAAVMMMAGLVNADGIISLNFSENDSNQGFVGGENIGPLATDSTNWNNTTGDRDSGNLANGGISDLKDDTGALTGAGVTWACSTVWWNADGTGDDEHKLAVGYLDDGDIGGGNGATVTITNIPYAEYRVYGLFATDNSATMVNVDVNGSWVLGGDATTSAPATIGVDDNFTVNGEFWTLIDGVTPGNYWTIETTGATCTIVSEPRNGNARGCITAVIIERTAAPGPRAWNPVPGNEAERVDPSDPLTWEVTGEVTSPTYNFYFGPNPGNWTIQAAGLTETSYSPPMDYMTTYHWQVDVVDGGQTYPALTGWTFTTGGKATDPVPYQGAVNVGIPTTDLYWTGDNFTTSYKVYGGEDFPLPYLGEVTQQQFPGFPTPNLFTTYHWRVDEYVNGNATVTGDAWSFTTEESPTLCLYGDMNDDCIVNMLDLFLFFEEWQDNPGGVANMDGVAGVNLHDFNLLARNWLEAETSIVISELAAVNDGYRLDEDGDSSDWIELYNSTNITIDIEGWYLTDNKSNLQKWEIPAVELDPGEHLVLFASGKNRRDPDSELHTNFELNGGGEFLALVKSNGETIAHAYDEYPQQFAGITYGLNTGDASSTTDTILLPEYSAASALIPENDSLEETWMNPDFVPSGWLTGTTGVGYDYPGLVGLDVGAMRYNNQTVYSRIPFILDELLEVSKLTLRMKFEDGFSAFLNGGWVADFNAPAPENLTWQSGASGNRDDSLADDFLDFDITQYKDFLSLGDNVLAIQGLNQALDSSDLLVLPELVASKITPLNLMMVAEGYFTTPTPGELNSGTIANLGPAILNVTEDPPRPADNEDLIITAELRETYAPVSAVELHYRVMHDSETSVAMHDDGLHNDGEASDGIYGAIIPMGASDQGEMVRWYVTALDTEANTSRNPLFPFPTDSPEYYGTVIADATINTQLPMIEWFVQNTSASENDSGARGSAYYNGIFYDNIYIHRRGGSTASAWGRVHQKFNFNRGYKFDYDPSKPKVNEFNLNHTYSDKAYLRQTLAFDMYDWCGNPGSDSFVMRGQRNGQFHGVFAFIEEPEEEMLEREGLDPDGALYKMYNTFYAGGSAEKKTRRWEGRSDLDNFCNAINNPTGTELHNNIFDQVDLPRTLNYLVATVLCHQNDHPHKNHYLYRDSDGSGEWFFMPWDHDLTYGYNWIGTSFSDTIYADDDQVGRGVNVKPSHPFIGRSDAREWNNFWNNLTDALLRDTTVQEMFKRRLRTVMDELLKAPGTPYGELFIENYIDDMVTVMAPDVALDYARWADPWRWGSNYSFSQSIDIVKNDYLDVRRTHLFVTHNVDNVGSYPISGSFSAELPNAQPPNPNITIDPIAPDEFNPPSYNQDEEYIQLNNNESYYVDISGWQLTGGVKHTFLPGTVIPAGGALYVSPHVATFRARSSSPTGGEGNFVQGDYKGHLSSWGETINLLDNNDTLVDTHTYTGNPSDQQRYLRITEMMYHPAQGGSYNKEEYEYIELINIGTSLLLLDEVKLTKGIYYNFTPGANVTLSPGDYIVIVKNQAAFAERYDTGQMSIAPNEYTGYLDNGGENIKLEDFTNSTILEFEYNDNWYEITDGKGFSLTIRDPNSIDLNDWDRKSGWRTSFANGGSPGEDDSGFVLPDDAVVINELLSNSDVEVTDWIELHNTTNEPINLGGWFLSDDADDLQKYEIEQDLILPAHGYVVFYEDPNFGSLSDPGTLTPFAFNETGDKAFLTSGSGGEITGVYSTGEGFDTSEADVAFGRYIKSELDGGVNFVAMNSNTPGWENDDPKVGPVVITEIAYHPRTDGDAEYVELFNQSGAGVELSVAGNPDASWRFVDDPDNPGLDYKFPSDSSLTLGAGKYLLLVKDLTAFTAVFGAPSGPNLQAVLVWTDVDAGSLSNGGEKLELQKPLPGNSGYYIRVDRVNYDDESPWPTEPDGPDGDGSDDYVLERIDATEYGNDFINWQEDTPTPGKDNDT